MKTSARIWLVAAVLVAPAVHAETVCQQMVVKHCVQVNPPQRDDEVQCLVDGADQCGRCDVIMVGLPTLRKMSAILKTNNDDNLHSIEKACEPWVKGTALQ